jgi:hypothetical protein
LIALHARHVFHNPMLLLSLARVAAGAIQGAGGPFVGGTQGLVAGHTRVVGGRGHGTDGLIGRFRRLFSEPFAPDRALNKAR